MINKNIQKCLLIFILLLYPSRSKSINEFSIPLYSLFVMGGGLNILYAKQVYQTTESPRSGISIRKICIAGTLGLGMIVYGALEIWDALKK